MSNFYTTSQTINGKTCMLRVRLHNFEMLHDTAIEYANSVFDAIRAGTEYHLIPDTLDDGTIVVDNVAITNLVFYKGDKRYEAELICGQQKTA